MALTIICAIFLLGPAAWKGALSRLQRADLAPERRSYLGFPARGSNLLLYFYKR